MNSSSKPATSLSPSALIDKPLTRADKAKGLMAICSMLTSRCNWADNCLSKTDFSSGGAAKKPKAPKTNTTISSHLPNFMLRGDFSTSDKREIVTELLALCALMIFFLASDHQSNLAHQRPGKPSKYSPYGSSAGFLSETRCRTYPHRAFRFSSPAIAVRLLEYLFAASP